MCRAAFYYGGKPSDWINVPHLQLEYALKVGEKLHSQQLLEQATTTYMATSAAVALASPKTHKGQVRTAKKVEREYQKFVRKLQAMAQGRVGIDVDEQGRPIAQLHEVRDWMIQSGVM